MKAKQLFHNDFPTSCKRVNYMSSLIILQRKCWAIYSVLLTLDVIWTNGVARAGTDGCYIYVNPVWFFDLPNNQQRAFLLAHEVLHVILRHPSRTKYYRERGYHSMRGTEQVPFNHKAFNICEDYVINADLIAYGLEPIPDGCMSDRFGRDELVDAVYLTLYDEQSEEMEEPEEPESGEPEDGDGESGDGEGSEESDEESEESGDDGDLDIDEDFGGRSPADDDLSGEDESDDLSGEGEADEGEADDMDADDVFAPEPSDHGGTDDHYDPQYEGSPEEQEADAAEDKAEIERKIDQALDSLDDAVDRGERHPEASEAMNKAGYRHGGEGVASAVDWRDELADVVTRKGDEGDVTWGRINRRKYSTIGVVMPTRLGTMDRMAVTIDTSGSVNRRQLEQFVTELAALIDVMMPTSGCLIMWTDTDVMYTDEVMTGSELLDLDIPNGGGTRMAAGAEYLEENGLMADVHLCFTDGDLWDQDDWNRCAAADVIMVLDRHPSSWVMRPMTKCGIRYIVACDDRLAA